MNVLAFDTSGPVIGVALCTSEGMFSRSERVAQGAEGRLLPLAVELCLEAGISLRDVAGIGAAHGPGAFTGLRVGLATASGLAFSLGVPIWTCDSLLPRALAAPAGRVLSLLDARKGRFYAGWYEGGRLTAEIADLAIDAVLVGAAPGFIATGEGALVAAAAIRAAGGEIALTAEDPATGLLSRLAVDALSRGEGLRPEDVTARYLREADAVAPPRA